MKLAQWNPFKEMENFFEHYPSELRGNRGEAAKMFESWAPVVDISETPKAFLITAELPGINKKDVKVEIDHGILTISGERLFEKESEEKKHHRVERFFGNFSRSFTLPETVNQKNIKADFKDGLLTVNLFKTEVPKPETIKVAID